MLNFMIYQNGGCKLPCWWGITPGVTKFDEMTNTLNTFVTKIENDEFGYGDKNALFTEVYYTFSNQQEPRVFELISYDGIVQQVDAYQDFTGQFPSANLLTIYGRPQEIYLATFPYSPEHKVPFSLILYYPDKGILAYYPSENGGRENGDYTTITICPQSILPVFHLWPAGDPLEGEIAKESVKKNSGLDDYKLIELASDFSAEQFYTTFRQKIPPVLSPRSLKNGWKAWRHSCRPHITH